MPILVTTRLSFTRCISHWRHALGTGRPRCYRQRKGNYRVKYWNAEWQKLMMAAIDDAMARVSDGV